MVEIKNVHKSFGSVEVLSGIDLTITPGKISVILGPNGSGKTTLVKSILGLVIPDKGDILIDDYSVIGKWEYRNEINYLPQIARFPENLTVKELIHLIKDIHSKTSEEEELIKHYELDPYLNKKLKNLSGGTRQKVNVVLFFMYNSPILIMDEPTAGLDPISLIKLKDQILEEKSKGKTIMLTTHIIPLVEEIADEIIFLLDGKLYFKGSWEELAKSKQEVGLERSIARILEENKHD